MKRNAAICDGFNGDNIMTDRHLLAINALATGEPITKAAEKAGVHRTTLSRWIHHNPYFMAELCKQRSEMRDSLRDKLVQAVYTASDAIVDGLNNPEVSASVKLQTACSLLHKLFPAINNIQYSSVDPDVLAQEMSEKSLKATFDAWDSDGKYKLLEEARKDLSAT